MPVYVRHSSRSTGRELLLDPRTDRPRHGSGLWTRGQVEQIDFVVEREVDDLPATEGPHLVVVDHGDMELRYAAHAQVVGDSNAEHERPPRGVEASVSSGRRTERGVSAQRSVLERLARVTKDEEARPQSAAIRRRTRVLSRRLDRWDPVGVYAGADPPPPGAYDFLVEPTMRTLHDGAGAVEIADMLARELVDHFGLRPGPVPLALAAELRVWWDSVATSGSSGTP